MEYAVPEEGMTGHDLDWIRSARLMRKKEAGTLTEEEAKPVEVGVRALNSGDFSSC